MDTITNTNTVIIQSVNELSPFQFFILNIFFQQWEQSGKLGLILEAYDYISAYPRIERAYYEEDFETRKEEDPDRWSYSLNVDSMTCILYKDNIVKHEATLSDSFCVHNSLFELFCKELKVYEVQNEDTGIKVVNLKDFYRLFKMFYLTIEYYSTQG
jgi:hypothetical protein